MELDEQMHNKFTSLKSLFKSTDPSKHFHGNKVKKFSAGKDQPDPSHAQLTSKSNSSNAPASMGFKDKLMNHYRENFNDLYEDNRIYKQGDTATKAYVGIHLYGRGTNQQIKKNDAKFARREKQITGNDSVKHSQDALMLGINRDHELNYQQQHHQQPHPEPSDPRLKLHKLSTNPILAKILPKKPVTQNPVMHDPQALLHKQDSFANQTPHTHTNPVNHSISVHPDHSPSNPIPLHPQHIMHPVQPKFHKNK